MLNLGCHLTSSKGYEFMARQALNIKADTFQFFTRNPRGGKAKEIDPEDVKRFLEIAQANNFTKIVAHAPYTLNPCSAEKKTRDFAYMAMKDDLDRMEYTPGNYYNFHPGSHVGQGTEKGIEMIADLLNRILKPEHTTTVLLETMAGKGSEVGGRFEELKAIIDAVGSPDVGVCLDTCHVYDAGYDIVKDLDGVLGEFDRIIGLDKLKALHLNDSKNPFASHKDRHECLGQGSLGVSTFARIVNHPQLRDKPMILETPNELPGYQAEIALLRSLES